MNHTTDFAVRRNLRRLAVAVASTLVLGAGAPAQARANHQSTGVAWHAQQAPAHAGAVADATATLMRNDNGVRYQLHTTGLTPGNVYTLWLVVVNEAGECAGSPCTGPDVILNAATRSQVSYAGGHVVGGSSGTFAGHVQVGPIDGWLPDRTLEDASSAEIHLVVNDHGPAIPGLVSDMLSTYRGGCSDASPFPGIFPPSAIADGQTGPNICRLFQSAIFSP
jgi:hypothetical protein